ncbi:Alpha-glucosidase 2 [Exophiala xenobiotica]|uniref:Alpha-galactosidase n=1 Tax=Lithohypha guttulata TaxID=1690604 RepID=A0ABR0K567_9EURO|nr:Alpha-glucosidase 2 [Lithohypha guttulata]KAK5310830.1 Alpha-glucosidase 2 [Exophiala xenobiotica]
MPSLTPNNNQSHTAMGSIASFTPSGADQPQVKLVVANGKSFALNGKSMSYRFHVDEKTGDLLSDHFGGLVTEDPAIPGTTPPNGWSTTSHLRREFPELGKGDFRNPAVFIKHHEGFTVSHFKYQSYEVVDGKPEFSELPATFGEADQVKTLIVRMYDSYSHVAADLIYSVFPEHDAIVRRVVLTNKSENPVTIEKLGSSSIDLPYAEYDMVGLRGEWARERSQFRRKVEYGMQSFGSNTGYSSHFYNPFLGITSPTTTESHGDAWGFSLVYTGSFVAEVEKSPHGLVRASIGMNKYQLSWALQAGETLASPECVAVYSSSGMGGMSRNFHRLYRQNLIKSKFVNEMKPPLLNSWEGLYYDFDESKIEKLATAAAGLGVKLFVLDDGWFGVKHPRVNDTAGLGDWTVNPVKFPNGLKSITNKVTQLPVAGSSEKLQFGIWIEPEMVSRNSELYTKHPDWVMSAGSHDRSETRNQLVLNLALPKVQSSIIASITSLLEDATVSYVKWDHNRAIHESSAPQNYHAYILGMYKVFDALTSRFPDILWEGCAAGGGRFDPGVLQYFPQIWASDNMDGIDRINIHFGTSVVYPLSTMSAHVGAAPSHITKRTQSFDFRAHVAMMAGSFGFELDPDKLDEGERKKIPSLIALAEKINPIIIKGDLWRLRLPEASNHPAAIVVLPDGSQAVLFAFQMLSTAMHETPVLKLQGLDAAARYKLDGDKVYSGATLMNGGIQFAFDRDYDSKVVFLQRL